MLSAKSDAATLSIHVVGAGAVVDSKQSNILINADKNVFLVMILGNLVPDNKESERQCTCPSCPTFVKSKFSGNVFCARGKASEKTQTAGCVCPDCPIFTKYVLDQTYYCVIGKSADLK